MWFGCLLLEVTMFHCSSTTTCPNEMKPVFFLHQCREMSKIWFIILLLVSKLQNSLFLHDLTTNVMTDHCAIMFHRLWNLMSHQVMSDFGQFKPTGLTYTTQTNTLNLIKSKDIRWLCSFIWGWKQHKVCAFLRVKGINPGKPFSIAVTLRTFNQ